MTKQRETLSDCPSCDGPLVIRSYRCKGCGTEVSGSFSSCAFCAMGDEDRYFCLVFLQCEGSIKDVERVMGISYPTVKGRLARVRDLLQRDAAPGPASAPEPDPPTSTDRLETLDRLDRGEIDFATARRLLEA